MFADDLPSVWTFRLECFPRLLSANLPWRQDLCFEIRWVKGGAFVKLFPKYCIGVVEQ